MVLPRCCGHRLGRHLKERKSQGTAKKERDKHDNNRGIPAESGWDPDAAVAAVQPEVPPGPLEAPAVRSSKMPRASTRLPRSHGEECTSSPHMSRKPQSPCVCVCVVPASFPFNKLSVTLIVGGKRSMPRFCLTSPTHHTLLVLLLKDCRQKRTQPKLCSLHQVAVLPAALWGRPASSKGTANH